MKFALFLITFWTLSVRRRGYGTPVSVSCDTVLPGLTDGNICKTGFSEFRHSTVKLFDSIFCDRLACHCEDSNEESEIPFCQHDVFFRVARSSSSFPLFPSGQHPDEKNHQVKNGHGRDAGCIDYHDCWSEWNCLKYLPYHEQIVRSFTRFLAAQTSWIWNAPIDCVASLLLIDSKLLGSRLKAVWTTFFVLLIQQVYCSRSLLENLLCRRFDYFFFFTSFSGFFYFSKGGVGWVNKLVTDEINIHLVRCYSILLEGNSHN